jgi:hypothetical protein
MVFSEGQAAFQQGTLWSRLTSAIQIEPFTRMILNDWKP